MKILSLGLAVKTHASFIKGRFLSSKVSVIKSQCFKKSLFKYLYGKIYHAFMSFMLIERIMMNAMLPVRSCPPSHTINF